ncbi:hypothetical protein, partial [Xylanibacter rodentium]|uniref:hypothetical protein n=1 Tax=Xylanibacter rodentium TaxID=2736289 RepID=UPI0025783233
ILFLLNDLAGKISENILFPVDTYCASMYVSCYLIAVFCFNAFWSLFYMAQRALTSDVVIMATVFMRMVEDYTKHQATYLQ